MVTLDEGVALPLPCVCVLPEGAGLTGVVVGVPGCCANARGAPKKQASNTNVKTIKFLLRRFII
jgi:hypothetical protein